MVDMRLDVYFALGGVYPFCWSIEAACLIFACRILGGCFVRCMDVGTYFMGSPCLSPCKDLNNINKKNLMMSHRIFILYRG